MTLSSHYLLPLSHYLVPLSVPHKKRQRDETMEMYAFLPACPSDTDTYYVDFDCSRLEFRKRDKGDN